LKLLLIQWFKNKIRIKHLLAPFYTG